MEKPTSTSGIAVSKNTPHFSKPTRIVILKPPEKEDKPSKNKKKPLKKPSKSKPNDVRENTPNITINENNVCIENTKYEQKHVPKLNSTSPEKAASERGPADSTPVHPDDVGSVHQAGLSA